MLATWAERHLLHPVLFFPGLMVGARKSRYSGLKAQCLPVCARLQSEFKDSLGGLLRPDFKIGGKERGTVFPGTRLSLQHHSNNQHPKACRPFLCFVCYYLQCLGYLLPHGWCSTNPFYNNPGHSEKCCVQLRAPIPASMPVITFL